MQIKRLWFLWKSHAAACLLLAFISSDITLSHPHCMYCKNMPVAPESTVSRSEASMRICKGDVCNFPSWWLSRCWKEDNLSFQKLQERVVALCLELNEALPRKTGFRRLLYHAQATGGAHQLFGIPVHHPPWVLFKKIDLFVCVCVLLESECLHRCSSTWTTLPVPPK